MKNKEQHIFLALFFLLFLAPGNLFKVWRVPSSYLNGIFVEYWAPKLYPTHFLNLVLLLISTIALIWRVRSRGRGFVMPQFRPFEVLSRYWPIAFTLTIIMVSQILSVRPALGTYHALSFLLGPALLGLWLWKNQSFARDSLPVSVWAATFFQACIGIIQWFLQQSLFGYWFLGEPQLSTSQIGLATSQFTSQIVILPYGTTPHPNILAGWLLIGILSVYFVSKKTSVRVFLWIPLLLCLTFTESVSAWLTGFFCLILAWKRDQLQRFMGNRKLFLVGCFLIMLLWSSLPGALTAFSKTPSLTRRARSSELILTRSFPESFIRGQGLTGNIGLLSQDESGTLGWRFLQPVHNIPLYLLSDLGFCAILLLLLFSIYVYFYYPASFLPIILITPIFSLDHYLLSTNSGQYLLIITCFFLLSLSYFNKPRA